MSHPRSFDWQLTEPRFQLGAFVSKFYAKILFQICHAIAVLQESDLSKWFIEKLVLQVRVMAWHFAKRLAHPHPSQDYKMTLSGPSNPRYPIVDNPGLLEITGKPKTSKTKWQLPSEPPCLLPLIRPTSNRSTVQSR